jgi:hypothetical protein
LDETSGVTVATLICEPAVKYYITVAAYDDVPSPSDAAGTDCAAVVKLYMKRRQQ